MGVDRQTVPNSMTQITEFHDDGYPSES